MRGFVYALAIGTLAAAMSTPVFAQSANNNNKGSLPVHNGGMQSNKSGTQTYTGANPTNTNNGSLPAGNGGMQPNSSAPQ